MQLVLIAVSFGHLAANQQARQVQPTVIEEKADTLAGLTGLASLTDPPDMSWQLLVK